MFKAIINLSLRSIISYQLFGVEGTGHTLCLLRPCYAPVEIAH